MQGEAKIFEKLNENGLNQFGQEDAGLKTCNNDECLLSLDCLLPIKFIRVCLRKVCIFCIA